MEVNAKASASQVEANLNQTIKELREKEEAGMQQMQNLTNSIETFKSQNSDMKASLQSLK
jgi:polyhydroxyalkanoate synthesis regulator phasin